MAPPKFWLSVRFLKIGDGFVSSFWSGTASDSKCKKERMIEEGVEENDWRIERELVGNWKKKLERKLEES